MTNSGAPLGKAKKDRARISNRMTSRNEGMLALEGIRAIAAVHTMWCKRCAERISFVLPCPRQPVYGHVFFVCFLFQVRMCV